MALHVFADKKFKTCQVSFYFREKLARDRVTVNSLLLNVLQRGTAKHSKTADLQKKLQELYGARLDVDCLKRGDLQVSQVRFEFLSEAYSKNIGILREIADLARDVIFDLREFDGGYLAQEKENLKSYIAADFNDKRTYAAKRLVEEMFRGQDYAINVDGYLEDVDAIVMEDVMAAHRAMIAGNLDVFVSGDVDASDAEGLFGGMAGERTEAYAEMPKFVPEREAARVVTERQDVAQAKLAMGFITDVVAREADYSALSMYNAIFGGGAYSKLFNNVREKHSLCYYANSRVDRFKGVMLVNAGIQAEDYEKAHTEILRQDEAIKKGDITEDEFTAARLGVINALRSAKDSLAGMESFYLLRLLSGESLEGGLDEVISGIEKVKKADIVRVASKVRLDTTYFLEGKSENEGI